METVAVSPQLLNIPDFGKGQRKPSSDYRSALEAIVGSLASQVGKRIQIDPLYMKYQIKRRRLYDVVNILSAIGCCERSGVDTMLWNGQKGVELHLEHLRQTYRIDDTSRTLNDIFSPDYCVSLPTLTVAFVLLFAALDIEEIDLREASVYLSRDTAKSKTTLCKLYQIVLILETIGVVDKSEQACIVRINNNVCHFNAKQTKTHDDPLYALSIEYLLNSPSVVENSTETPLHITRRRAEFRVFVTDATS